jgi:hypothetical protein
MNPLTRIGIETAALILVLVALLVLVAYLLGAFLQ